MKNANMLEHFIKKYSGNDAKTWKLHHKIKTNNTQSLQMATAFSEDEILDLEDLEIEQSGDFEIEKSKVENGAKPKVRGTAADILANLQQNSASNKSGFSRAHILGDHDHDKKVNHQGNFQDVKYKTVRESSRWSPEFKKKPGLIKGQIKAVTKDPVKFNGTGKQNKDMKGEARFLTVGIKKGHQFEPQHMEGPLEDTSDGNAVGKDENGTRYQFASNSDTASYVSRIQQLTSEVDSSVKDIDSNIEDAQNYNQQNDTR